MIRKYFIFFTILALILCKEEATIHGKHTADLNRTTAEDLYSKELCAKLEQYDFLKAKESYLGNAVIAEDVVESSNNCKFNFRCVGKADQSFRKNQKLKIVGLDSEYYFIYSNSKYICLEKEKVKMDSQVRIFDEYVATEFGLAINGVIYVFDENRLVYLSVSNPIEEGELDNSVYPTNVGEFQQQGKYFKIKNLKSFNEENSQRISLSYKEIMPKNYSIELKKVIHDNLEGENLKVYQELTREKAFLIEIVYPVP